MKNYQLDLKKIREIEEAVNLYYDLLASIKDYLMYNGPVSGIDFQKIQNLITSVQRTLQRASGLLSPFRKNRDINVLFEAAVKDLYNLENYFREAARAKDNFKDNAYLSGLEN
mmetsp:Transcript_255/g.231  ORF Transcript_255/g.231 Transcript_255/m.231 type:complete len:113 (-) Transcript_255:227-565(-)